MKDKDLFRVGFIQNSPVFGEIEYNLSIAESLLTQNTADLTILPELFSTGYHFLNKEEESQLCFDKVDQLNNEKTVNFVDSITGINSNN